MPLYRVSLVREQTIPVTVRANSKEDAAALAEDLYDKDILDDGFGSESDGYDSDLTRVYEATAYDDRGTVYDADSIKHKPSDDARRYVADILRLATKQIPDAEIGSIGDCHPSDEDVISVATEPPSGDLGSWYEAGQLLADGFRFVRINSALELTRDHVSSRINPSNWDGWCRLSDALGFRNLWVLKDWMAGIGVESDMPLVVAVPRIAGTLD